jgi:hypothetical protein
MLASVDVLQRLPKSPRKRRRSTRFSSVSSRDLPETPVDIHGDGRLGQPFSIVKMKSTPVDERRFQPQNQATGSSSDIVESDDSLRA